MQASKLHTQCAGLQSIMTLWYNMIMVAVILQLCRPLESNCKTLWLFFEYAYLTTGGGGEFI